MNFFRNLFKKNTDTVKPIDYFYSHYLEDINFIAWLDDTNQDIDMLIDMVYFEGETDEDLLQLEILKYHIYELLTEKKYIGTLSKKYGELVYIDDYNEIIDEKFINEIHYFYEKKAIEIISYIEENVNPIVLTEETKNYFIVNEFINLGKDDADDCMRFIIGIINLVVKKYFMSH